MVQENKVLATVGGYEIKESDVEEFIRMLGPQGQRFQSPHGMNQVTEELINQELLYLEARDQGYDKDQEFLDELKRIEHNLLRQYAMHRLFKGLELSDEEVANFYEDHKDQYHTPMTMQARHILVDKEAKAITVREEIEKGLDFAQAAMVYSSCPSKEAGGDLGKFPEGQMVPEFEEVCKTLPLGTLSQPVKTQFGYHLIEVTGREEAHQASFEEVSAQIRSQLLAMKQQEVYVRKASELKDKYEVKRD